MDEMDDRLAGDPVWELFTHPLPDRHKKPRARHYRRWLVVAGLIAAGLVPVSALGRSDGLLAVAAQDFRTGRQLARSIPSKAGGTICTVYLPGGPGSSG